MTDKFVNIAVLTEVATALQKLNREVVYVGGAVVSIYVTDEAADEVRPTQDVDLFLEIVSVADLENVREQLTVLGFLQSADDDVICRFRYRNYKVDVMSTQEVGWAPANPWFAAGMNNTKRITIAPNLTIQVLALPYFLASKFEAFHGRGADARQSHDVEDIVYVLDSNNAWETEIATAPDDVKNYLLQQLQILITDEEILLSHLADFKRAKLLNERLKTLF